MRNVVESLENRYNLPILDMVQMYEAGMSRDEIAAKVKATTWAVRNIMSVLNLRWKKKHRVNDLVIFNKRMAEYDGEEQTLIDTLTQDLELLEKEVSRISRTNQQLRDSNTILRKRLRAQDREDYFAGLLQAELKEQFDSLEQPKVTVNSVEPTNDGTMFLVMSDIHHNELIDSTTNNGFNTFNREVCYKRLHQHVQALLASPDNTKDLKIYLLGDIINGIIHHGDLTGELPPMEALVEFSEFLTGLFSALSKAYSSVEILMVNGNHSRITDQQKINQKVFDLEYIVYNYLKVRLPEIPITYSTTGYLVDTVGETKIGLFHGDTLRGYNGYDFSNTYRVHNIFKTLYNSEVSHFFSGHTHRPIVAANQFGGFNVVNGCVSGTNEYGMSLGLPPILPTQYFGRFNTDGSIGFISPVILD